MGWKRPRLARLAVLSVILGVLLGLTLPVTARAAINPKGSLTPITSDAQRVAGSALPVVLYTKLDQPTSQKAILTQIKQYREEAWKKNFPFNGTPIQTVIKNKGMTHDDYVNGIQWDSNLEAIAIQRAVEASILMDHTRPDGSSCFTAVNQGASSFGECLAWGGTTMAGGLSQWYEEKAAFIKSNGAYSTATGHYYTMINPSSTVYGGAAATVSDGSRSMSSQSLEAGNRQTGGQKSLGYSGWYTDTVYCNDVSGSNFAVTLKAQVKDATIMVGSSTRASASLSVSYKGFWNIQMNSVQSPQGLAYTSSDQGIATVDANGAVTGKKSGNVQVTIKGGSDTTTVAVKVRPVWNRLAGNIAYDTMSQIVRADGQFKDGRGGTVIVATGDGYWDALSAAGLAGLNDAPVVTTPTGSLGKQAAAELSRLKPQHVIVMGGKAAISDSTMKAIKKYCPDVKRVEGATARETAYQAFKSRGGWGDTCIIATASGYWDALSIAPYAYAYHAPIFLTNPQNKLDGNVLKAARNFKRVIIVGGTSVVSGSVEGQLKSAGVSSGSITRLAGANSIATSRDIAKWELSQGMTTAHLTVATGDGYWDALAGAPLAGKEKSVLVLTLPNRYEAIDAVYDPLKTTIDSGHVLGGTAAVPTKTIDYLLR